MIEIQAIKKVYLLGIGGIGMSALARYFRFIGKEVSGYDRTASAITDELAKEGISVHFEADLSLLPKIEEKNSTLIIYTPAVPSGFGELVWLNENGFILYKRSKVLGLLASDRRCIAIAGTHGKTSVTTMTAHLLKQSAVDCSAFMGGISRNYGTNLLLPSNNSPFLVAEADEFDRSFLQLYPELAVITFMDADHLDIYGSHEQVLEAFKAFVGQIRTGGALVYRSNAAVDKTWNDSIRYFSYSIEEGSDFQATALTVEDGAYHFNLKTPFGVIENIRFGYPGLMNVENAVAASALALLSGVKPDELKAGLAIFKGVERRFDIRFRGEKTIYIDDYGHHPRELEATIRSVRHLWPDRKITGIFQPHLFTRTRDFATEFAESLDLLDEALVLEIYPAREEPIAGVDTGMILNLMKNKNNRRCSKSEFPAILDNYQPEILLTMGAGDIDRLIVPIVNYLETKENG